MDSPSSPIGEPEEDVSRAFLSMYELFTTSNSSPNPETEYVYEAGTQRGPGAPSGASSTVDAAKQVLVAAAQSMQLGQPDRAGVATLPPAPAQKAGGVETHYGATSTCLIQDGPAAATSATPALQIGISETSCIDVQPQGAVITPVESGAAHTQQISVQPGPEVPPVDMPAAASAVQQAVEEPERAHNTRKRGNSLGGGASGAQYGPYSNAAFITTSTAASHRPPAASKPASLKRKHAAASDKRDGVLSFSELSPPRSPSHSFIESEMKMTDFGADYNLMAAGPGGILEHPGMLGASVASFTAPWASFGLDASTSALASVAVNPFEASAGGLPELGGIGGIQGEDIEDGALVVVHDPEDMVQMMPKKAAARRRAPAKKNADGSSAAPRSKKKAAEEFTFFGGMKVVKKKSDSPKNKIQKVDESGERWGRWTDLEHTQFLSGLHRFGKKWKLISGMIETRSVVQIRSHAQKYFKRKAEGRDIHCSGKLGENGEYQEDDFDDFGEMIVAGRANSADNSNSANNDYDNNNNNNTSTNNNNTHNNNNIIINNSSSSSSNSSSGPGECDGMDTAENGFTDNLSSGDVPACVGTTTASTAPLAMAATMQTATMAMQTATMAMQNATTTTTTMTTAVGEGEGGGSVGFVSNSSAYSSANSSPPPGGASETKHGEIEPESGIDLFEEPLLIFD
jgi:SHAQKYF class myb-like DNA-binding protein